MIERRAIAFGAEARARTFPLREIRATEEPGNIIRFTGHAAVFDTLSEDLGGWREKIARGAFRGALGRSDVRALINHDPNFRLGRMKPGTLTLREDDAGLYNDIRADGRKSYVQDLRIDLERGDIDQESFSFWVRTDQWQVLDGENVRTVVEVDELFDVSIVTFPAYPTTDVQARSVLASCGFELPAVAAALVRAERKLTPLPADRDLLMRTIATLQRHLEPDAVQGDGAARGAPTAQGRGLPVRLRELELVELGA